ncbi:MAG: peptidyl-prolyl cis-trans isomerase [Sandaracinaceae bacterium]
MRVRALSLALGLATLGCGSEAPPDAAPPLARGDAVVGGDVVATVDGVPIRLADVEAAARLGEVSPTVALRRLEDEILLARAAARAGFDDAEARRAERRAAVQALLERDVEARIPPSAIDEAELEAAYAAAPSRFSRPEQRRSMHVWAHVPEGAPSAIDAQAHEWIESVRARLAASPDPAGTAFAFDEHAALPFEWSVEEEEPLAAGDGAEGAYAQAVLAMEAPGVAPEVVRSPLGWHAIVLTRIEPPWEATHDEAIDLLRQERLDVARARAVAEIIAESAQRAPVEVDERAFMSSAIGGAPP